MTEVCCWWCGVQPDRLVDVTGLGDPAPSYMPIWPGGDHEHAVDPPTPGQLVDDGHRILRRILEDSL